MLLGKSLRNGYKKGGVGCTASVKLKELVSFLNIQNYVFISNFKQIRP
jgi:hypothetical protein